MSWERHVDTIVPQTIEDVSAIFHTIREGRSCVMHYDAYSVNTDTFMGRYALRSDGKYNALNYRFSNGQNPLTQSMIDSGTVKLFPVAYVLEQASYGLCYYYGSNQ